MALGLCEVLPYLGETSTGCVITSGLLPCVIERRKSSLRGRKIVDPQCRTNESQDVVGGVLRMRDHLAPPIQGRLISATIGDLGSEAGRVYVVGVHLQGPPGGQHRRFGVAATQMRGRDADQVSLLPLTKKTDADDREGDEKKQTNDSADDELNESPLGFFRVFLQWAERKGQLLEVNLGAFALRLGEGVEGTASASVQTMILLHSRSKEQREAIRNLVHLVLTRDMGTFNPDRFKDWIKEVRTSRTALRFASSSHVPFDDRT
jgi:hypothetical protein